MVHFAKTKGHTLEREAREKVVALIREHGEAYVVRLLGCGRSTLARGIAGLGIRLGSIALIEQRLRDEERTRVA